VKEVSARDLSALIAAVRRILVDSALLPDGSSRTWSLYLVAGTSHLAEGWRDRVPHLELAGDSGGAGVLGDAVREAAAELDLRLVWESPADVIPLPPGWSERARPVPAGLAGAGGSLEVRHFDPYGVVLRLVARGDEPDYVEALEYVRRGWVDLAQLEAALAAVVPRFTSETLAQDPAEFRRKFRGLRQLIARDTEQRRPA
jgi:hypothetical protein